MNAADVLNPIRNADAVAQVAALLAHGKQGVAILPDGTLWALERYGRRWISNRLTGELYETDEDDDSDDGDPLYRLVPVSAEAAGDTDG